MSPWIYNGATLDSVPEGALGFVYRITHLPTGKKYIGKKLFQRKVTRPPLKGSKRKRRSLAESDWRDYTGSCEPLNELIAQTSPDSFSREILILCYSKGELSYQEALMQFKLGVLLSDDYFNGIIQCRINKSHLKSTAQRLTHELQSSLPHPQK